MNCDLRGCTNDADDGGPLLLLLSIANRYRVVEVDVCEGCRQWMNTEPTQSHLWTIAEDV